jgi:hypothetical protein
VNITMTNPTNFLLVLALAAGSVKADSLVYVVDAGLTGNGQFGTINLSTGGYQAIGPVEPDGYDGLAPGPNGSLLSLTYAGNLDSINPATGVPTKIGATGLGACVIPSPACGPNSVFSVGGVNGKIYATDFQNNLYSVNGLTGAASKLPITGLPPAPYVLGSSNPDGTLNLADEAIWGSGGKLYLTFDAFVLDPSSFSVVKVVVAPALYQIDPLLGTVTNIGPTDLGIGGATDVNGVTYVLDDATSQILTLDLASGKTSFVANFDPAAGVINGAAATVPEPVPVALALVGVGVLAVLKKKRRV